MTVCPRSAAVHANAIPAGPAPTTPRLRRASRGNILLMLSSPTSSNSVSWQAIGLTRQEAVFPTKAWSRQAWLQAMHVLMLRDCSFIAFWRKSGSARSGRAMLMRSETPSSSRTSAVSGALMRLVETIGGIGISSVKLVSGLFWRCRVMASRISDRSRLVGTVKAPRGTLEAIVGTRDSCQPIPVLRRVTPASRNSLANVTVSSQDIPPSTSSHKEMRKTTTKSFPRCLRTSRTISKGNRDRFSKEGPPY
mmetsp:Transcript_5401/g.13567  ORF Transcript_5401/g.13567 Transcript_5401/m.13567 type:complete len:250 (+) Transcript_5401:1240-1989(+)